MHASEQALFIEKKVRRKKIPITIYKMPRPDLGGLEYVCPELSQQHYVFFLSRIWGKGVAVCVQIRILFGAICVCCWQ